MTDETTTSSDVEVEALEADIEQTRGEMTGTVQAIGDRLDPANVMQNAKETVREATIGRVENMASTAADTANDVMYEARSVAQDAGSGIVETIRRNPIPAAMAGIGLGWLFMNRSSGRSSNWDRRWDTNRSWDQGWQSGSQAHYDRSRSGGSGSGIGERAGEAVEQVGQRVSEVGEQAGRVAGDVRSTVGEWPDQFGTTARDVSWNAQRFIGDNPLAVGAVAVAVGAAIGMALPETEVEKNVLGQATDKAITQAEQAASDAVQQLETSNA